LGLALTAHPSNDIDAAPRFTLGAAFLFAPVRLWQTILPICWHRHGEGWRIDEKTGLSSQRQLK
jgi:hypothetical protein